MNQVTAKRRMGIAARDHITISRVHLKLHSGMVRWGIFVLCVLVTTTSFVVGIAQPNIESAWEVTKLEKGPGCS